MSESGESEQMEYTHIFSPAGEKLETIETPMSSEKKQLAAELLTLDEFMCSDPEECSLGQIAAALQITIRILGFHSN